MLTNGFFALTHRTIHFGPQSSRNANCGPLTQDDQNYGPQKPNDPIYIYIYMKSGMGSGWGPQYPSPNRTRSLFKIPEPNPNPNPIFPSIPAPVGSGIRGYPNPRIFLPSLNSREKRRPKDQECIG